MSVFDTTGPEINQTLTMADTTTRTEGSGDRLPDWTLETPVAMMIYNRPERTRRVFETISSVEPPELFVIADGPRRGRPDDAEACRSARAVTEDIDWDCTTHREYADSNLGLKDRVQTGLDWLFDATDEAIILEDDCLPTRSFFRFADALLDEYREDDRVMDISGSNHLESWRADYQDYHFTRYGGIWGWATWADQWKKYRPEMGGWSDPDVRDLVRGYIGDETQWPVLRRLFDRTANGTLETWDYQWQFTKAVNWGLTAAPAKNTVTNIGFGAKATNTTDTESQLAGVPRDSLEFPLDARDTVAADSAYDRRYFKIKTSLWDRHPALLRIKTVAQRLGVDELVG